MENQTKSNTVSMLNSNAATIDSSRFYCESKLKTWNLLEPDEQMDAEFLDGIWSEYLRSGADKTRAGIQFKKSLLKATKQIQRRLDLTNKGRKYKDVEFPEITEDGRVLDVIENVETLCSAYEISVRYNIMCHDVEIKIPGLTMDKRLPVNEATLSAARDFFVVHGIATTNISSLILQLACQNAYHPVIDWMDGLEWDGQSRFDDFAGIFNLSDEANIRVVKMYLHKWLIQCVAALYRQDYRLQGILTLLGAQGGRKSTLLRSLVPSIGAEWCGTDISIDPHNKDDIIKASRYWLLELGECDQMTRKVDVAAIKNWSTSEFDEFRIPYAKTSEKYKRMLSVMATLNNDEFLTDDENRRWWIIPVISVNVDHTIDVCQLWAEAKARFDAGEAYWLDKDEIALVNRVNNAYTRTSVITDLLQDAGTCKAVKGDKKHRLNATELLKLIGVENPSRMDRNECTQWLRRNGFIFHKNTAKYEVIAKPSAIEIQELAVSDLFSFSDRHQLTSVE